MAPSGGRTPQPGVGVTARLEAWGQEECDKCPRPLGRFHVLTVEPDLSIKDQDRKKHHGWGKPGGGQSLNVLDKKQKVRKPPTPPRPAEHRLGPGGALTRALVCGARGEGAAVEAPPTALAVGARRVVQAAQAVARQGVAVAHGVGVHVPAAMAPPAGLGVPREPQWVPKEAVITDLAATP